MQKNEQLKNATSEDVSAEKAKVKEQLKDTDEQIKNLLKA